MTIKKLQFLSLLLLGQLAYGTASVNDVNTVSGDQRAKIQDAITAGAGSGGTTTMNLPLYNTGTSTNPVLNVYPANGSTNGYISSTDWTTFNGKVSSTTYGSSTVTGLITSVDWTNFNAKGTGNVVSNAVNTWITNQIFQSSVFIGNSAINTTVTTSPFRVEDSRADTAFFCRPGGTYATIYVGATNVEVSGKVLELSGGTSGGVIMAYGLALTLSSGDNHPNILFPATGASTDTIGYSGSGIWDFLGGGIKNRGTLQQGTNGTALTEMKITTFTLSATTLLATQNYTTNIAVSGAVPGQFVGPQYPSDWVAGANAACVCTATNNVRVYIVADVGWGGETNTFGLLTIK